jgi:DNA-binding response OmpR family regulator
MDVLIIENDEPIMRLIAWALASHGLETDTTTPTPDIVEYVRHARPRVVIFNTGIAAVEKRSCIRELRDAVRGVRVIDVVTGARQPEALTGADGYLEAPLYPDKAIDLVQSILRDGDGGLR